MGGAYMVCGLVSSVFCNLTYFSKRS